jgi:hypothetical protein
MELKELSQAIPSAYTEWIGRHALACIEAMDAIACGEARGDPTP